MTILVVELFEMIHIDHHDGQRAFWIVQTSAFSTQDFSMQGFIQKTPVVQAGERILDGLLMQRFSQAQVAKRQGDLFHRGLAQSGMKIVQRIFFLGWIQNHQASEFSVRSDRQTLHTRAFNTFQGMQVLACARSRAFRLHKRLAASQCPAFIRLEEINVFFVPPEKSQLQLIARRCHGVQRSGAGFEQLRQTLCQKLVGFFCINACLQKASQFRKLLHVQVVILGFLGELNELEIAFVQFFLVGLDPAREDGSSCQ
ncbi:hypothetical protein AX13_05070 [Comamonas aquatica DA1877]|uniref:Uncharacterized protein n=1 Tax=Comamonas aquatica DA1877 TaxID=1457173 RepID=A0A014MMW4_9BURK|nr:hypothetical protein AX13_05070 [Comamonas aquatica DA1877]